LQEKEEERFGNRSGQVLLCGVLCSVMVKVFERRFRVDIRKYIFSNRIVKQ